MAQNKNETFSDTGGATNSAPLFVYSEGDLFMLVNLENKKYKLERCWSGSYDNPIPDFEPFTGTLVDFIAGLEGEGEVKILGEAPSASIFEGE